VSAGEAGDAHRNKKDELLSADSMPDAWGSNIGDLTLHSMGPLAAYLNLTGLKEGQKGFHPGFTHFHGSGLGLGAAKEAFFEMLAGGLFRKE